MSGALLEAAPAVVTTQPSRSWAAVFTLARFEARKLLSRVLVLLALAAYTGWIVWRTRDAFDGYPALQDADRATQGGPLLVGLAVLLCVNHAMLRSRRHDTERHFAVLVLQPWQRTAAHVLSVAPVAVLVTVGVAVQFAWQALRPGAIGHGSPSELLVGPLVVLLFGAVGALLARVLSSLITAPLLIVFCLLVFVLGTSPSQGDDGTRWLYPVVGENTAKTLPSDLLGRPAAWHALYLLGLALAVALCAIVARAGRTPHALKAVLGGALVLAVVGGACQTAGVPAATTAARERASVTPEKEQTCVREGRSTYCAFPEWTPRTGTWAGIVDQVQSLAGGTAATRPLLVRQRVEARYGLSSDSAIDPLTKPGQVSVGTAWGGNRVPEFAAAVASVLVAGKEKAGGEMCDGRMVTVMWLALGAQSDPVASLRNVRLDDSVTGSAIVLSPTEPLSMTTAQTEVVRELFDRPRAEVTAKVKANWTELTSAKVTAARAAELLGVAVPKGEDKCDE
ncbi:ABC transporter permease [Streptomyces sp. NPDC087903]|uniref:ABC transporter permease n=1 Tax=Streptomyces sp. NPDC087903 TaxID=3365819 RepID=UPI00382DF160